MHHVSGTLPNMHNIIISLLLQFPKYHYNYLIISNPKYPYFMCTESNHIVNGRSWSNADQILGIVQADQGNLSMPCCHLILISTSTAHSAFVFPCFFWTFPSYLICSGKCLPVSLTRLSQTVLLGLSLSYGAFASRLTATSCQSWDKSDFPLFLYN